MHISSTYKIKIVDEQYRKIFEIYDKTDDIKIGILITLEHQTNKLKIKLVIMTNKLKENFQRFFK